MSSAETGKMQIKIGTRGSKLALWQANYMANLIGKGKTEIVIIKTKGDVTQDITFDKMEGKGFFTKEIENALLDKKIDLAVHSLKDLSTESIPGLKVSAIPGRENPADMLLIRPEAFDEKRKLKVKQGTVIGTSSLRRTAQIRKADAFVNLKPLRGNVDTRIEKLRKKEYGAIVLACAGIIRLDPDISDLNTFELPFNLLLPAPAQGALGLQTRSDDQETIDAISKLNHNETVQAVTAEREFMRCFGGGCHVPLGAYATVSNQQIHLTGIVASVDGLKHIRESVSAPDPETAGKTLSRIFKEKGAGSLL